MVIESRLSTHCRDLPGGGPSAYRAQPRPPRDLRHLLRPQEAETRARGGRGACTYRGHRQPRDPAEL